MLSSWVALRPSTDPALGSPPLPKLLQEDGTSTATPPSPLSLSLSGLLSPSLCFSYPRAPTNPSPGRHQAPPLQDARRSATISWSSTSPPAFASSEEWTRGSRSRRRRLFPSRRRRAHRRPIRRYPMTHAPAGHVGVLGVSLRVFPLPFIPSEPCSAAGAGRPAPRACGHATCLTSMRPTWPWSAWPLWR
jgi:hypothetical protein